VLLTKSQAARRIFWTGAFGRRSFFHLDTIARMHFRAPSIDPGVMAFIWALLLAAYLYFFLLAVGTSAAFAIVIALLAFAGIWLYVRLRGEERPGA
jgi:Flp pilus assembly protein TadB